MTYVHSLTLDGVTKSFGELSIIRDVNLQVRAGERHALIGPNGAGKSTLFNLISGRLSLTSGTILLDQAMISGKPPETINRAGLSRSFQISNIFAHMTVFENVRIAVMRQHGLRLGMFTRVQSMTSVNRETDELVHHVGLAHRAGASADSLTYSEQRALEIGLTLATRPSVVLLDEPTAGMSREETAETVDLIRRTTEGLTLLVVEHDMTVVFGLSDRISVLVNGNILATGTPAEVKANNAVRTAYLGEVAL